MVLKGIDLPGVLALVFSEQARSAIEAKIEITGDNNIPPKWLVPKSGNPRVLTSLRINQFSSSCFFCGIAPRGVDDGQLVWGY